MDILLRTRGYMMKQYECVISSLGKKRVFISMVACLTIFT